MNYLSLNIKHLRKLKNLTQLELANNIGSNRTNIATWERTSKSMKVEILIRISKFFHISIDNLLLRDLSKAGEGEDMAMQGVSESVEEYTSHKKGDTLLIEDNKNITETLKNMSELQLNLSHTIERLMDRMKELEDKRRHETK